MKDKKKSLLTSLLAIVLCLSLITGSTFALFTSTDKVDITVKSGKVKISAAVDNLKLYSATIVETEDEAGTIETGNHAATYYYEGVDEIGVDEKGYFTNTGTAEYHTTGEKKGTLELDRVTPGDKVTFKVGLTNSSNVNIKYRVVVTVTSGLKLFRALKVKIDGSNLTGVSRTGNWTSLEAGGTINNIPVEIYMPIDLDGEEYMDISTAMRITVEAVQGNAKTTDEILTTTVETEQVETAVADSQTTAATEIKDSDELVIVTIPANTTLTSETDTALAVKVKPQDTSSAALEEIGNFTVLSNKESASYDVSVLKVVSTTVGNETVTETSDAIASNNGTAITVKMFIGAGLTGVELYHTHEENTTKFTSVANENDVDTDKFYYNAESGYVTFKTLKFSEYTVVYNADYAYETADGIKVLEATETAGVYQDSVSGEIVAVNEDAQGNVTTTTMFAGGTGTQEDPFLIYDYATMQSISDFYDKGYYYFAVDLSKTNNGTIDCTGWVPVKLHGSFDGKGVTFNNVTACLFLSVGYELENESIVLKDFDAVMNVSSNGQYGAAALVKNIFNSGITTFNDVNVHGYLEGYWNMGSFYNYGTANYDDVGSDYEVDFVNCSSDATIVCASGNVIGGLFGHSFEGAGHSFTLRVDNSEYTGHMFLTTSNGKGNKYFGMTSDWYNANNHFYFNGVEDTFNNGNNKNAGAYTNSTKIDNVTATKASNGYMIAKHTDATKIVATITAQLTAYDTNNVKIPNLSGITMTLSSSEIVDLDGDSFKVLDLFDAVNISLNATAYDAGIADNTLNISIANSANYKSGNIRLQVNQYDSTGTIVSAGTIDIATCANATGEWIVK